MCDGVGAEALCTWIIINANDARSRRGLPCRVAYPNALRTRNNMTNLTPWRWRGVALGGRLQRGVIFCLTALPEASTAQIAEYCEPTRKSNRWQLHNHARAARSVGAEKVRREGCEWVWRLSKG